MSPVAKIFRSILLAAAMQASLLHAAAQGAAPGPTNPDSIQLKNTKGKMVLYGDLARKNPIVLICFWSVNNESSIQELTAVAQHIEGWNKMASFTFLPICVDDAVLTNRMRPLSNQNGWTFEVFADLTGELQRLLNFGSVPQSMILQKGQVVYQQAGYTAGTENYLFNKILALSPAKKGPIK